MKKIVTIGEIVDEVMATKPGDGVLEPISLVGPFPSGAPAIFIDQVGRLGQPCGMVGRVGDDDFGRVNTRRLAAGAVAEILGRGVKALVVKRGAAGAGARAVTRRGPMEGASTQAELDAFLAQVKGITA